MRSLVFTQIARSGVITKSKFIDCQEDSVSGLADMYDKTCAGEVPSQVEI